MRWKVYAVLIALLIASGVGLWKSCERLIEQRVRAEELQKDLDRVKREGAVRDSAHVAEIERLKQGGDSLKEELALAERAADRQVAQLPQRLTAAQEAGTPDSIIRGIQATVDAVTEKAETCNLVLRACYDVVGAQEARIADLLKGQAERDSLVASIEAVPIASDKPSILDLVLLGIALDQAIEQPKDIRNWGTLAVSGLNVVIKL